MKGIENEVNREETKLDAEADFQETLKLAESEDVKS